MTLILIVIVFGILLISFLGTGIFQSIYTGVIILSNFYGMLFLVLLLAHGLIKLPIYLWKKSDFQYNLVNALSRADRVRRAYRSSLIEYHEQISICKTIEDQYSTGFNRRYFDVLMSEIPDTDLEGQKIARLKSIGGLELKRG